MIIKKRDSLENFIREQLIGPGGCNYQFYVCHEENEQLEPGCSFGEVINTTPGSIYSSAILFPKKAVEDVQYKPQADYDGKEDTEEDTLCIDNDIEDELVEEKNLDNSEDIDALERRFPNKFGISCCLDESKINEDIIISVSGRYYP